MAQKKKPQEENDPRRVYADIIDLPRHQSKTHPHMSLEDRAAQFSPFMALTGYEDMVTEEARITDRKIALSEEEKQSLDEKLSVLTSSLQKGEAPLLTFTYFVPDAKKQGGRYERLTGVVRKIDQIRGAILLKGDREIPVQDILTITGEIFAGLES